MDYRFDLKQASSYVAEITTKNVRGRFTIIVQVINQTLPVMHLLAHGSYTTCSAVFNWLGRVVHVCCWFLCPLAHIGSVSYQMALSFYKYIIADHHKFSISVEISSVIYSH
ncbi:hypothetical protein Godav_028226 [Gossypium davidsonii]|uniref:Uncharacterized protein n=2 Tax=Gossypium TaxID=3633 RepID=A0A7J8RYM1_GOSDV|nr:hypothetical protein [Gossypium davidsonii]MBA0670047.1 hypothetical protein [Gossypium klotzschianum]